MLSRTDNYIAGTHTFDYERFQRTFLHWTRGAYFKSKGEEKLLKHMAMETMFGDFYIVERIFLEAFYHLKLIWY